MKRFLVFAVIALGVFFLVFAVVFFFRGAALNQAPLEDSSSFFPQEITDSISSFIYRYDNAQKTYIPENSQGWESRDFARYIFDAANKGSIKDCRYFVYDAKEGISTMFSTRKCNSELQITLGEGKLCPSQGKDACLLYVFAADEQGNAGTVDIGSYSIDYEAPSVGKVFIQENQTYPIQTIPGKELVYHALVSDNQEVSACWLYEDGQAVGIMELSCDKKDSCEAKKTYAVSSDQERHTLFVQCADHYDVQTGKYINVARGQGGEVAVQRNHAPEILSCRILPTQGTQASEFRLMVQASDPDGDILQYEWDFGDGETSQDQNPTHRYQEDGVFQPRVSVQDPAGETQSCSTAWAQVSE